MRILLLCLLTAAHGAAANYYVATNGLDTNPGTQASPFLTVQKGANTAVAGDFVYVATGRYAENVRCNVNAGSAGSPIIIDGQNVASVGSFTWEVGPYIHIKNFTITDGTNAFGGFLYVAQSASHCVFSNNVCDALFSPGITPVIRWNGPASAPFGTAGSFNLFVSNVIKNVRGEMGFRIYGYTNTFVWNQLLNFDNTDYFQLAGATNYIIGNTCSNLHRTEFNTNNHSDIIQIFGDAGGTSQASFGHIIESNYVIKADGVAQLGNLTDDSYAYVSDLTIRNNIFIGIAAKISIAMPNVKVYNNVFYQCATNTENGGAVLIFGDSGSIGKGNGGRAYNNVFLDCGPAGLTNTGGTYFSTTLTNVSSDYNYVAKGPSYLAVKPDPSQRSIGEPGGWDVTDWWEDHGINGGNPLFVNEAALNFHLSSGSFLIGAATNLNAIFSTDFDGTVRGGSWDVGAYEILPVPGTIAARVGPGRTYSRRHRL